MAKNKINIYCVEEVCAPRHILQYENCLQLKRVDHRKVLLTARETCCRLRMVAGWSAGWLLCRFSTSWRWQWEVAGVFQTRRFFKLKHPRLNCWTCPCFDTSDMEADTYDLTILRSTSHFNTRRSLGSSSFPANTIRVFTLVWASLPGAWCV